MKKISKNNPQTTGSSWSPFSPQYAPGGQLEQIMNQQSATRAAHEAVKQQKLDGQMATALLGLGLFGVGAGLTGTKLYNLVSRVNPVKNKYKKFGPGPHALDADEKVAEEASWLKTVTDALSAGVGKVRSALPPVVPPIMNDLSQNQQAFFVPAALATAGLGLYGGHSIARALEDRKKKEDMEYELAEAKKDYQRALTGKRAEALDAAFENYAQSKTKHKKTAAIDPLATGAWLGDWALAPLRTFGALPLYTSALAGTGLLSGKMMYDWTRERSKDKALERARRSRARIDDANPLYIDPSQLAAIKALSQKEVEKVKQRELA